MLIKSIVLALAVLCSSAAVARDLTDAEKKIVADVVTKRFKDPEDARFKWLPVPQFAGNRSVQYCGLVSGKNSFGAYVGYAPFQVMLVGIEEKIIAAGLIAVSDRYGSPREIAITSTCKGYGQDPARAE